MLSAFQKERDAFWRARQDSFRLGSLPCDAVLLHRNFKCVIFQRIKNLACLRCCFSLDQISDLKDWELFLHKTEKTEVFDGNRRMVEI